MAGRCPSDLEAEFIAAVQAGLTLEQLAEKYGVVERTVSEWKRKLRDAGRLHQEAEERGPYKGTFSEEGNYAELVVETAERVRSYEDLCGAFNVDLKVWKRIFFECGTHEGWRKNEDKDLKFTHGVMNGYTTSKGILVVPLYRTKARFIRREPVAVHPVIRPVECQVTYRKPKKPKRKGVKRALLGGDPHYGYTKNARTGKLEPFHDRRALDLFLQVATYEQPELIVLGGDIQDFPNMQDKFLRDPDFDQTTQPSLEESHWWLRQLREACSDAEIVLEAGNHEDRMRKAILAHFKVAYELRPADELELPPALSPERLMGLHSLGIEWVGDYPNGEHWLHDGLRVIHGATARQAPGATARGIVERSDVTTVFFHVHRRELVSRTMHVRAGPRAITALSPGCLCRIDGVVPGTKKRQNWQQGMALVDYTDQRQTASIIEIEDGQAVWDRRVFVGRDRMDDLRRDMPDWNW